MQRDISDVEGECNVLEVKVAIDGNLLFQSSPAPEGECNERRHVGRQPSDVVSILTRP